MAGQNLWMCLDEWVGAELPGPAAIYLMFSDKQLFSGKQ
jgi:hypothetical protein